MLQVVSLLGMEPPAGYGHEDVRDEKTKILRAIPPLSPDAVVRGQFAGYRDEPGVAKDSTVETFVALRLHVDTWRWAGVPFYIRAGKCLPTTATEVLVRLHRPPEAIRDAGRTGPPNYLRFRLSPDVAISLGVRVKAAGEAMNGTDIELALHEQPDPGALAPYERLLEGAMAGDGSLFAREDAVEAAWRVVDPILRDDSAPYDYEPGTWGPDQGSRLVLNRDRWRLG